MIEKSTITRKMAFAQRMYKTSFCMPVPVSAVSNWYCVQQRCIGVQKVCMHHHSTGAKSSLPVQQWSPKLCNNFNYFKQNVHQSSQRTYSQQPWIHPLGKIDRPKKKDMKEPKTSALVQLEDLSPRSLTYLERLHDAESSPEVLEVLQEGSGDAITEFSAVHYGRALCRLADIHAEVKQNESERGLVPISSSRAPVLYDKRFKDMCQVVLQESRHMEHALFLESLAALQKLRVPLKSSMMYTFLAQAEHRLNSFGGAELAQFAGTLGKLDKGDPRVGALLHAVAILTPRHISDLRSLHQVLLLVNTIGTDLDGFARGKLANMLLAVLATDEERTLGDILQAVLALHRMDYKLEMLLELACPVLTENIQELKKRELHMLVCALGNLRHEDERFFTAASECILEQLDDWEVTHLINVVEAFSSVQIKAPLVFDSILKRLMESKQWTPTLDSLTILVRSLAKLDHRPPSSWKFDDFICATISKNLPALSLPTSGDCRNIAILANCLASVDIFPEDLLDFAASRKFANGVMMIRDEREYKSVIRDLQSLTDHLEGNTHYSTEHTVLANLRRLIPTHE